MMKIVGTVLCGHPGLVGLDPTQIHSPSDKDIISIRLRVSTKYRDRQIRYRKIRYRKIRYMENSVLGKFGTRKIWYKFELQYIQTYGML